MAKIRIIERNRKRRMKITLTNQREIQWLGAIFEQGHTVTQRLYDGGLLGLSLTSEEWYRFQYAIYEEYARARRHIEH